MYVYIYVYIRAGQIQHGNANTEISTRHGPPNPHTARITPTRQEHANTTRTNTPNAASKPNSGNTDTANTGNWAQVHMNIQIGSSQVSADPSTRHNPPTLMHTYINIYIHNP